MTSLLQLLLGSKKPPKNNNRKNKRSKRNSMFLRLLAPVTIVMFFQAILIGFVLFINGTIDSLKDSSIEVLQKNVQNRGISLENLMVHNWTNIDSFEKEFKNEINAYINSRDLSLDELLSDAGHQTNILENVSTKTIETLRLTSATGIFVYFIDDDINATDPKAFNGIRYRDLDPVSTPSDHSDILFLNGSINIARKDKIQLDNIWNENLTFTPENKIHFESYSNPLSASISHPELSSKNLSYWSSPHLSTANNRLEALEFISYTRPILVNGKPVAMIGTEIKLDTLIQSFPSSDFNDSSMGGYMLLRNNLKDNEKNDEKITPCEVLAITGSYIKRSLDSNSIIELSPSKWGECYSLAEKTLGDAHVALQPLMLYNTNAPFSDEQWLLASIDMDTMLFASSNKVSTGILGISIASFVLGLVSLIFVIRRATKPINDIVSQLEGGEFNHNLTVPDSSTYEFELLCKTINSISHEQRKVELLLREERERYLIALESAADTFIEYDIEKDSFMIYYFFSEGEGQKPGLFSKTIPDFTTELKSGKFCHNDDVSRLISFLRGRAITSVEVRIDKEIFSHITELEPEREYYWFSFKASHFTRDDGKIEKTIGIARHITNEKIKEFEQIEAVRHDSTTGLYKRDYGLYIARNSINFATRSNIPFTLCIIRVDGFNNLEAHYGRVFCAVLIMNLGKILMEERSNNEIQIRFSNDEFIVLLPGANKDATVAFCQRIEKKVKKLYAGENTDLPLNLFFGISLSPCEGSLKNGADSYFKQAYCAAVYAADNKSEAIVYYGDIANKIDEDDVSYRDRPISISLDMTRAGIVGFVFDLFERTTDIKSAINILLFILGEMFSLDEITICSYDPSFDSNHTTHHWKQGKLVPNSCPIRKISHDDFSALESLLDKNGTLIYTDNDVHEYSEGINDLLCVQNDECFSALCCTMYENGSHFGRILFKATDENRTFAKSDVYSLYEITKIISAHISIEKSNSASKAKGEFLSRISHEIRTPMNAIIGMTKIAKEKASDPVRLSDSLDKIDFSANHLLALINDVLEMSRIESGKLKIENEPFSLDEFMKGLETLMRPQIEGKGITFVTKKSFKNHRVISDEYRLRQVLVNFLGNAVKFTNPGGTITCSIEEMDGDDEYKTFKFSVKDTGHGISYEDQINIFNSFEQAQSEGRPKRRDGTGLGLAISRSIINAMGSEVMLKSKLGKGSNFFFSVRLKTDETNSSAINLTEKTTPEYKAIFEGKKLLLVEDNEINVEIALHVLEEVGFNVDVAENGKVAVDKFMSSSINEYNAILMDIRMPIMNGLEATREIRQTLSRKDARTVPIVAMTANAFDSDMKESISSGMNGHVAKPIMTDKLYSLLETLL